MGGKFSRIFVAVAVGVALTLGGSGCSSDSGEVLPPVIAALDSIDGTTVQVPVGGSVDLVGDETTFTDWSAEIDSDIVTFTPGRDDGSAQFNPGLTAVSAGSTEVALTNASTDETVRFAVEVTGKK